MSKYVGIRHEDLYSSEVRAPLTPAHVEFLVKKKGMDIVVQRSHKRIFTDKEYELAGAKIADNLDNCNIILGVKEIPIDVYEPGKTYVNFSHVIKGQDYNMPRLQKMIDLECNLIDYEKITDEQGHRVIFFGHYAGLAGMINSLWALGLRLEHQGYQTPFRKIKQAHKYHSLEEAKSEIEEIGNEIAENGLPENILPLTIGFAGYGHTSQGAQEILGLLPVKEISPERLLKLKNTNCAPKNLIYKVVFHQEHMAQHDDGKQFNKNDYYRNPQNYSSIFETYLPSLTVLMNCIYWKPGFPRLVTRDAVAQLFKHNLTPKLQVIGDITCDPDGSIEITHKGTEIDDPLFVYNPDTGQPVMGHTGKGLLVMAVHILPSELPREASEGFSNALIHYLKPIVDCDFDEPFAELSLPMAIKKALIVHQGRLTPGYQYLNDYLNHKNSQTVKATEL